MRPESSGEAQLHVLTQMFTILVASLTIPAQGKLDCLGSIDDLV